MEPFFHPWVTILQTYFYHSHDREAILLKSQNYDCLKISEQFQDQLASHHANMDADTSQDFA